MLLLAQQGSKVTHDVTLMGCVTLEFCLKMLTEPLFTWVFGSVQDLFCQKAL